MEGEMMKEIINLMNTEVNHTFETREMIFNSNFQNRQAIFALIHILLMKGIITAEDVDRIWSCFESKEGQA